ncbi:hypothetical protein Q428_00475 [Fervidicella metallireducens AeB]|uniref:Uncharacterized protein n=1 Tax=Fervidicella metallireducens AeB TaxID=1403537 RepID=A0A017RZ60_9CLOT|nr:hypothetical protein [Fervidicella metallireducens]EYE89876.1 hypothetical protein Q428_00475 [Fervidicella metallireducens AeB]
MEKCIYCGSTNLEKDVTVETSLRGSICGLKYNSGLLPEHETLHAELCKDCGSVRLYIKDTEHNWI